MITEAPGTTNLINCSAFYMAQYNTVVHGKYAMNTSSPESGEKAVCAMLNIDNVYIDGAVNQLERIRSPALHSVHSQHTFPREQTL